jgi:hypothetical protein
VVSDNSSDANESRRLEEFCARTDDPRLHYVRPPEELPMPAHWEWLWRTLRDGHDPSHVAYLTDRLVFVDDALDELCEIAERHPDRVVSYHWDHVKDLATPVELVQTQWTGRLLELDTHRLAELSSRGEFGNYLPRLMTCVAPVSTVEAIERRFGDIFGPTAPDYRFAYRCLAVCDTLLYLDRACMVERAMASSGGNSYKRGQMNEAARDFARWLSGPRYRHTPEPAFETLANAIFDEYCAVRAELGEDRLPPPPRDSYLATNAVSVDRIVDPEWRAQMEELLRRRGWTRRRRARRALTVAAEVAGYFARHPGALARSVKRQLLERPPGTPAASLLPRVGLDPGIRDDLRFASTAEAIAHANSHPRPTQPYAWHVHRLERAGAIRRSISR